jgi:hypothetical protein
MRVRIKSPAFDPKPPRVCVEADSQAAVRGAGRSALLTLLIDVADLLLKLDSRGRPG